MFKRIVISLLIVLFTIIFSGNVYCTENTSKLKSDVVCDHRPYDKPYRINGLLIRCDKKGNYYVDQEKWFKCLTPSQKKLVLFEFSIVTSLYREIKDNRASHATVFSNKTGKKIASRSDLGNIVFYIKQ